MSFKFQVLVYSHLIKHEKRAQESIQPEKHLLMNKYNFGQ